MKPTITIARKACEAIGARQVVVVSFDGKGRCGCTSYGETKAECTAVKPTCEAIFDKLMDGDLPAPDEVNSGECHYACVMLEEVERELRAQLEAAQRREAKLRDLLRSASAAPGAKYSSDAVWREIDAVLAEPPAGASPDPVGRFARPCFSDAECEPPVVDCDAEGPQCLQRQRGGNWEQCELGGKSPHLAAYREALDLAPCAAASNGEGHPSD